MPAGFRGGDAAGPCPRPALGTGQFPQSRRVSLELVFRPSALVFHCGEDPGLPGCLQDAEEETCHGTRWSPQQGSPVTCLGTLPKIASM